MSYDYNPLPEEEAQSKRYTLLDDGVYRAHVINAKEKLSKSNNKMCELLLEVYDDHKGIKKQIYDFLLFTDNMIWKLKHFCDAANLSDSYLNKRFSDDIAIGSDVLVQIKTDRGALIPDDKLNGRPRGSRYPDKNAIEDYVVTVKDEDKTNHAPKTELVDDDIPF